jgi:hypothetical protein
MQRNSKLHLKALVTATLALERTIQQIQMQYPGLSDAVLRSVGPCYVVQRPKNFPSSVGAGYSVINHLLVSEFWPSHRQKLSNLPIKAHILCPTAAPSSLRFQLPSLHIKNVSGRRAGLWPAGSARIPARSSQPDDVSNPG